MDSKTYGQSPSPACSPGSELRAGYKIAFNEYGQVKRWRILKIQNGLALVTEGWGVHKIMSVASIALCSYMIEETGFPWYLRPFYRENVQSVPPERIAPDV